MRGRVYSTREKSITMAGLGQNGVIQFTPPAQLEQQLQQQAADKAARTRSSAPRQPQYPRARRLCEGPVRDFPQPPQHQRRLEQPHARALRTFNGQYDPTKLAEISKWGGSTVYARLIAQKCRAASSLLRDIYLGQDMPVGAPGRRRTRSPAEIKQKIDS
jgi:hypothetical protein